MNHPPTLLTTREVAEWLNVSVRSVLRWYHDGLIPGVQLIDDGPLRFDREEIESWLRSRSDRAVSAAR